MPELILLSGKRAGKRLRLPAGEVVVGRDEDCKMRLTSNDVSRRHCVLQCDASGVTVVDLGSRNRTFVNDIAINTVTPLRPGDRLRVGPFMFQLPGAVDPALSDDDVAGWLNDEAGPEPTLAAGKDTAYIPRPNADNDTTELQLGGAAPAAAPRSSEPAAPRAAAELDPTVAQAAEVIRAYWIGRGARK